MIPVHSHSTIAYHALDWSYRASRTGRCSLPCLIPWVPGLPEVAHSLTEDPEDRDTGRPGFGGRATGRTRSYPIIPDRIVNQTRSCLMRPITYHIKPDHPQSYLMISGHNQPSPLIPDHTESYRPSSPIKPDDLRSFCQSYPIIPNILSIIRDHAVNSILPIILLIIPDHTRPYRIILLIIPNHTRPTDQSYPIIPKHAVDHT